MMLRKAFLTSLVLAGWAGAASGVTLYRETFPATPNGTLPEYVRTNGNVQAAGADNRGKNVLDQGWDIIRSRQTVANIVIGLQEVNGALTEVISANSGAIFANADTVPIGTDVGASGGVNNNPFLPGNPGVDYGDGILFASAGFWPFLMFTEEVPAGTQASDVNYARWRGRNNAPNANPGSQTLHAVLQVDGAWWVHETGLADKSPSTFNFFQIDISGGNWAPMDVVQMDTVDFDPLFEVAEITGAFDQPKPSGTVGAWGLYNFNLTGNTRFDYIEFGTDIVQNVVPEPGSMSLLSLAGLALAARCRPRRK